MDVQFRLVVEKDNSTLKEELLDRFNISRREYRRIKAQGEVYVNGIPQRATCPLKSGDKVEVVINNENQGIEPIKMDLDIVYEDPYFLLLNKPGDILVHPVHNERSNTLANGVKGYYESKGEKSGIHPIHRLDRETSGLVLFAKNPYIHNIMGQQLERREIEREYLALVHGRPIKKVG